MQQDSDKDKDTKGSEMSEMAHGNDYVDWGGTSKRRMNPWITADALTVLRAADRI